MVPWLGGNEVQPPPVCVRWVSPDSLAGSGRGHPSSFSTCETTRTQKPERDGRGGAIVECENETDRGGSRPTEHQAPASWNRYTCGRWCWRWRWRWHWHWHCCQVSQHLLHPYTPCLPTGLGYVGGASFLPAEMTTPTYAVVEHGKLQQVGGHPAVARHSPPGLRPGIHVPERVWWLLRECTLCDQTGTCSSATTLLMTRATTITHGLTWEWGDVLPSEAGPLAKPLERT